MSEALALAKKRRAWREALKARRAAMRERWKRRKALVRKRLKVAELRWCFIHGPGRAWNDKRHQVVRLRCVYAAGGWWCMRGGHPQHLRGRAFGSEKAARSAARQHARQHLRWIASHQKRLQQEERQVKRDIVRFA